MTITKPMLACDFDETKLVFPLIAQPKIDGVRGLWLYGKPSFSGRSLKQFANTFIIEQFNNPLLEGIDGELTYGIITDTNLCSNTTSVCNTKQDDRAFSLVLNAFDYITPTTVNLSYIERIKVLTNLHLPNVTVIPSTIVHNLEELNVFEQHCLVQGYEGVILRKLDGTYKNGRTTIKEGTYMRIKRFVQEDAIVLQIIEAQENTNPVKTNALGNTERSSHQENKIPKGMLGSLICRDIKTSNIITVGPGEMSHNDRMMYFNNPDMLLNKTISYKYFPKGIKDKPRFPTFVTIRDQSDIIND